MAPFDGEVGLPCLMLVLIGESLPPLGVILGVSFIKSIEESCGLWKFFWAELLRFLKALANPSRSWLMPYSRLAWLTLTSVSQSASRFFFQVGDKVYLKMLPLYPLTSKRVGTLGSAALGDSAAFHNRRESENLRSPKWLFCSSEMTLENLSFDVDDAIT